MKIDILNVITGEIIHSCTFENNNIKKTVINAVKNKISLSCANLSDANLSDANLSDADLCDAGISSFSYFGSSERTTYIRWSDKMVKCGCFWGNIEEFEKKVKRTHKEGTLYYVQYISMIQMMRNILDNKLENN